MNNKNPIQQNKRTKAIKALKTELNEVNLGDSSAKTRWQNLRSHLEFASTEWAELDKQDAMKSPEEQQFEKVKSIIENLKDKLNEF